jgi:hypothetical protein
MTTLERRTTATKTVSPTRPSATTAATTAATRRGSTWPQSAATEATARAGGIHQRARLQGGTKVKRKGTSSSRSPTLRYTSRASCARTRSASFCAPGQWACHTSRASRAMCTRNAWGFSSGIASTRSTSDQRTPSARPSVVHHVKPCASAR